MSLIDKWKESGYLQEDDQNLANLLEYMSSELDKKVEENNDLFSKVLPLTVNLYKEGIRHFDFGLIVYCLEQGKEDAISMYKKLIK
jgi:hypothetical protein